MSRRIEKEHRQRLAIDGGVARLGQSELSACSAGKGVGDERLFPESWIAKHGHDIVISHRHPHRRDRIAPKRMRFAKLVIQRIRIACEARMTEAQLGKDAVEASSW